MTGTESLVPMPDAVRLTGRSNQTLRSWARQGKIRGQNLGGRLWVFQREDLERYTEGETEKIKISA